MALLLPFIFGVILSTGILGSVLYGFFPELHAGVRYGIALVFAIILAVTILYVILSNVGLGMMAP